MLMNIVFVVPMLKYNWPAPHAGLALATTLSAFLNAGLLLLGLKKARVYSAEKGWSKLLTQAIFAAAVMGTVVFILAGDISFWINSSAIERVIQLSWIILVGAITYFAILWSSGVRFTQLLRPKKS